MDIQEAILRSPTFFQHYRGVSVDWSWFRTRDRAELERRKGWLARHRVRVIVDFSNGLDLYPTLTLLDAFRAHFDESVRLIDDVLDKALIVGARDAVITLHRKPENHWTDERARSEFVVQLRELSRRAGLRGMTVHLQAHRDRWVHATAEAAELAREAGSPNLRVALNTGHAAMAGEDLRAALAAAGDRLGAVLLCAADRDRFGQWYDAHLPVAGRGLDLAAIRELAKREDLLFILDGAYRRIDDAWADLVEAGGQPSG
jgi:sugar phosphate isomerase/epimerase